MRQLFIDSRDRTTGTSTNFSIQLQQTLRLPAGSHKMRVDNLRVPLVMPYITSGVNDLLYFRVGDAYNAATLSVGSYNGFTLAAMIQTRLTAAYTGGTWTVEYFPYNCAMSISCTSQFTLLTDAEARASGRYGPSLASFATARLFNHDFTYTSGVSGTKYMFSYVSVQPVDIMYLTTNKFANVDTFGPQGDHSTIMCAVVTEAFGNVMDASMPADVWITCPGITTQSLDFCLRDRSYNVIQNLPNISFTVTID